MLSVKKIVEMMNDGAWLNRYYAMVECIGRSDVDVSLIEKGLGDENWEVRAEAFNACIGRSDIDASLIEKGLGDENLGVRRAAFNACIGRTDIDSKLIEKGLEHKHWKVRIAAYKALKESGYEIPLKRTFEPPETVYKKCRDDVIVSATIPDDAQVRGYIGSKCRASAAVITDVIGDFNGEKVGASYWDSTTQYYVGDAIEIDNFDYSDKECSTGFHFFCTLEEAKRF